MLRSDFNYELPAELIVQQPVEPRSASRLLALEAGALRDLAMRDFPSLLKPGDLLVFNDTRVIPARLHGHKDSGGKVEILIERLCAESEALAQLRASKPPQPGSLIHIDGADEVLQVLGREGEFYRLRLIADAGFEAFLDKAGHVPLPPYIHRADDRVDRDRYQTVFAKAPGAVAAPTAGLHFDAALLDAIAQRGVKTATLTLHVGAGTFQPLRVADVREHRMHAERYEITAALCQAITQTRAAGGRLVAVGTTVCRALESAAALGDLTPHAGETRLFITPGYSFKIVDALLTNFHLPESTLLMLVCAFGGQGRVLDAYRHAVAERYRFFSYGDAMWLERNAAA
ncbi:MAG: tRNA preQ1(34) S-adenosylmethionine ribosyltransferase-isomerase QueA [Pseudomonadota bacterium]